MSTDPLASVSASSAISDLAERRLAAVSFGGALPQGMERLPQAEQAKAVAGQFEAILLRQFLQDSVGNLMGGKGGGPSGSIYGYMLTDVLASRLAQGGGLGLGSVMQQQLSPRPARLHADATPATPGTHQP